jgi:hypothetical protein
MNCVAFSLLLSAVAGGVAEEYTAYFSSLDPVGNPFLGFPADGPISEDPVYQTRAAQVAMIPVEKALARDLERIAVQAAGGMAPNPARDDLTGDGAVSLADWDALVALVWNRLTALYPLITRRDFGLVFFHELGDGPPATATSPGVLASAQRLNSDLDVDGTSDGFDNCVGLANPSQSDMDGDGLGDSCDPDADGDGVMDRGDLCPGVPLEASVDADRDGCPDTACALADFIAVVRFTQEGVRNSFATKATHACERVGAGRIHAAEGVLRALAHEARAVSGVHLPTGDAERLARMAENAVLSVGGVSPPP